MNIVRIYYSQHATLYNSTLPLKPHFQCSYWAVGTMHHIMNNDFSFKAHDKGLPAAVLNLHIAMAN